MANATNVSRTGETRGGGGGEDMQLHNGTGNGKAE